MSLLINLGSYHTVILLKSWFSIKLPEMETTDSKRICKSENYTAMNMIQAMSERHIYIHTYVINIVENATSMTVQDI